MELKETLNEIVSKDFEILKRHDEFLEALQEKVEEKKDYNTINRIMRMENLAAKFYDMKDLSEEEKLESIKEIKKAILTNVEIMEERLDYILDAFTYAITHKSITKAEETKIAISAVDLDKKTKDGKSNVLVKLEKKSDDIDGNIDKPVAENKDFWICECGAKNSGVFCGQCGKKHGELSANEVMSSVAKYARQEFNDVKESAQIFSEKASVEIQKATAEFSEKAKKKQENYSENSSQNLNFDAVLDETNLPEKINREPQILQTDYSKKTSYCSEDTRKKYISFEGRMNRKVYWIMGFKLLGWYLLACVATAMCEKFSDVFAALIFFLSTVIALISSYSFTVRRFHDLNRTGWWSLTFFVPYINLLTSLYAIFASGTEGDNDYGPDPLKF